MGVYFQREKSKSIYTSLMWHVSVKASKNHTNQLKPGTSDSLIGIELSRSIRIRLQEKEFHLKTFACINAGEYWRILDTELQEKHMNMDIDYY